MRLRLLCLVGFGMLWPSSAALAFCRTTTQDAGVEDCACQTEGFGLAWPEPAIEVVFAEDIPEIRPDAARRIVEQAFAGWESVRCDNVPVDLAVQIADGRSTLGPRDPSVEPETNVIGYLTSEAWSAQNFDRFAFAQTAVRFFRSSGRIAGADIWLHGDMRLSNSVIGKFGVCPEQGCSDPSTIDLPNVMTHEIGHFFGLAHSPERGATMACRADPGQTDMRTLEQDDRDGLCAIYPPGLAFRGPYVDGGWQASKQTPNGSCSALPAYAEAGSLSQLALCVLAALALCRRGGLTSLRR